MVPRIRWIFLIALVLICQHSLVTSFVPSLFGGRTFSPQTPAGVLSFSESASVSSKDDYKNETYPYNFWDENLTITAFNMDLHNLVMDDPMKAIDAIEIMEQFHSDGSMPNCVRPDSASYTTIIEGLCYGNHHVSFAERAQALLDKMEESDHLQPNQLTYLLVCQKWSESVKQDYSGANAQRAHDILLNLKERGIQPSKKLYSIVLEGWCRRAGRVGHAMNQAEAILREMEANPNIRPNVITYTSVIGGLARSNFPDLATRADGMLERMKDHSVEPDMVAFTSILNCWSKAVSHKEREQALDRSLEIIRDMENQYVKDENYHVKPNAITYVTAIRAIGNSLHPDAPKVAEKILWRMYNLTNTETIHVPPNVGVWNAVITAFSKSGSKANKSANAKRAEQLLVEMLKRSRKNETAVEPNVRTWGAVLRAWAESREPDSGEQAQRVLNQMQKWYEEGKISARPNVVCYTTVMNAWGRGSAPSKVALKNVEGLLQKMENLYEETLDVDVRPNKISYVTALDVFSRKSKDRVGSLAQSTIDRMVWLYSKDIGFDRPTRIIFNALINAWSKSTEPNAAANAEKIFRWMEAQYQAGDDFVKPDLVSLCGVLNAWANHAENGGARRAQEIINHTETLTLEERGFAHSIICYNILIKAWGRSRTPESVACAEKILMRLEEKSLENKDNIQPDITTYSSVINCCAYYSGDAEGQAEALQVAMRTFARIKETGGKPNHITYGTMIKAIGKLTRMGSEREEKVKTIFEKCCKEGQVDSFVLSQIRAATSPQRFQTLVLSACRQTKKNIENQQILKIMPPEWGRNVLD